MDNLKKSRTGYDALILTFAKFLTLLLTLVSGMLLARFRTLTEYGTYSQIMMTVTLVCSILMLGLPNSINYFLARAETIKEKDEFLSVYYTLNTLLSFFVGVVLIIAVPILEKFYKNSLISSFWYFLAVYPWTKIILSSVEHFLVVYKKTKFLLVFKLLHGIFLLGCIVVIKIFNGTFMQYMLLYLLVEGAFALWIYFIVKSNCDNFKFKLDKVLIKTIFKFSIPIGLASVVGTINIELDKLVITSFFTTEELAIYTNASKELPVTIIATSITSVLLPQLVRLLKEKKTEDAVKLWNSAAAISFSIISLVAIGCFVFAPEVVTILYSEKYLGGVSVFRVYCCVLLLHTTYYGIMLNATANTKIILVSSICSLVLNMVLNIVCYSALGFIGPAIATFIATLAMQLFQTVLTCKKLSISFSKIFPWLSYAKSLLLNVAIGVTFYFIKNFIDKFVKIDNIVLAIGLGIAWAAIYVLLSLNGIKRHWKNLNN